MDRPQTRYASTDGGDIAYQVLGDGPFDLLHFWGFGNIDVCWEWPPFAEQLRWLASFSRLILMDRRGTGLSDPVPHDAIPTWEEFADDITAVLDAVHSEEAAIFAEVDAGPVAVLFAAMHPARVRALVLANTMARFCSAEDYPIGRPHDVVDLIVDLSYRTRGTPDYARLVYRSIASENDFVEWIARCSRGAMTPKALAAQLRYLCESMDVRHACGSISAPTLVFHHSDNFVMPVEMGSYIADHIPGARFYELPGDHGHLLPFDSGNWRDAFSELLTGASATLSVDRILSTVLFTDIVDSTKRAAALGDRRWRELLDRHDALVRDQLGRFNGREIKTTGDGFHVSFDGPARASRCALAISRAVEGIGLEIRAGIHTGECEVRGDDLAGLAVHIAARIGAAADPGEVLVSGTVAELVAGSGLEFVDRGDRELKGVPGRWRTLAVVG